MGWTLDCGRGITDQTSTYCEKHEALVCSCGKRATRYAFWNDFGEGFTPCCKHCYISIHNTKIYRYYEYEE
jgi:hypothetical protein